MSSQNEIIASVTQVNGSSNFSIDKGVMVKEKDYESFIKSYFDYQARVDVEKQKVLQEQVKVQAIKYGRIIAGAFTVATIAICLAITYWSSNDLEKRKLELEKQKLNTGVALEHLKLEHLKIEKKQVENNKTK